MMNKIKEGFTLVEILIVVVIIGILATIAIPTYFSYVEKGYASDAKVQMKNILENSSVFRSDNPEWPKTVEELNDGGYANVKQSTLEKWSFTIDLSDSEEGGVEGTITAISTAKMKGGPDKEIVFDVVTGIFAGYGQSKTESN